MAKSEAVIEEASQDISAPEAVQIDLQNEIVALYCQLKPGRENIGSKLELPRAGEPNFELKAGQFVRIKRSTAEWHLAKSRTFDQTNPLMLRIMTLEQVEEMTKLAGKNKTEKPAPASAEDLAKQSYRFGLVDRVIKAGILSVGDEDKDTKAMSDKDLRELLGEPEPSA